MLLTAAVNTAQTDAAGFAEAFSLGVVDVLAVIASTPSPTPAPAQQPSGGFPDDRRSEADVRRAREFFGVIPKVVEEVARDQAKRLELDEQKRFEQLQRELQLQGIEWDVRYLEAMNEMRNRMIDAEIALRLRQRLQDDEDLLMLMVLTA